MVPWLLMSWKMITRVRNLGGSFAPSKPLTEDYYDLRSSGSYILSGSSLRDTNSTECSSGTLFSHSSDKSLQDE